MKISLKKFESAIDERIVSRGEEYFDSGAVRGLKKIKDDRWVASVDGTETYKVYVDIKGDNADDYSCSCPYDLGPVCKHVVAVLFAVREVQEKSPKSGRKAFMEEAFEDIIARLPRKVLNTVLLDYAGCDTNFVDFVSARSSLGKASSNKNQYHTIIQNSIDAVRGRHGHIGYWGTSKAVRGADMVLDKAQEFFDKNSPDKALPIFQAVLEEMLPLLQEADDSNGDIGGAIWQAFEGLSQCVRRAKDEVFKKSLFDYLLKESGNSRYVGWNSWRWELLRIAAEAVGSSKERDRLFARIDDIEKTLGHDDGVFRYDAEQAVVIKLAVIERTGTQKDVEAFLNDHLDCTPLRERAVDRAIDRKDLSQAKELALDGLAVQNSHGLPGLINKWKHKLLDIAQMERDEEGIKKYALEIFLDVGTFEHYERYKKRFLAQQWPQEVQRIIDLIKRSKDNRNNNLLLPQIYIQEERWQDLFDYAKQNSSASAWENFAKYLEPRFSEELTDIYEKIIIEKLAPPMGRGSYQYLCRFLQRMQKLGDKKRVKLLIDQLSTKYSNRPAMLEEMKRV